MSVSLLHVESVTAISPIGHWLTMAKFHIDNQNVGNKDSVEDWRSIHPFEGERSLLTILQYEESILSLHLTCSSMKLPR